MASVGIPGVFPQPDWRHFPSVRHQYLVRIPLLALLQGNCHSGKAPPAAGAAGLIPGQNSQGHRVRLSGSSAMDCDVAGEGLVVSRLEVRPRCVPWGAGFLPAPPPRAGKQSDRRRQRFREVERPPPRMRQSRSMFVLDSHTPEEGPS